MLVIVNKTNEDYFLGVTFYAEWYLINRLYIILEDAKCQGIKTKQDICCFNNYKRVNVIK